MTILIKYPKQTIKTNKKFFKRKEKEFTSSDWCKWAGWWDTDGHFQDLSEKPKGKSKNKKTAALKLKDKQPIELFSKTFETSLGYYEHATTTPEKSGSNWLVKAKNYTATLFNASLSGDKARWFTKNIYPYLISEQKKNYAVKVLGYRPPSKDIETWTREELIHYLGSAIGGDGSVSTYKTDTHFPLIDMKLLSSNAQHLSDVKYIIENIYKIYIPLAERFTYQTAEGEKTAYHLRFHGARSSTENFPIFENLIKENVMCLDRKKNKIQDFLSHAA